MQPVLQSYAPMTQNALTMLVTHTTQLKRKQNMRKMILATVFAAMSTAVMAQDATDTTTTAPEPLVNTIFSSVCASDFILSPKAQTACEAQTMPKAVKNGSRFTATSLGTEFNTLHRQMVPQG